MEEARWLAPRGAHLATLLALLSAGACGGKPARPPNVILVSLDTLRADRLSCYGYARPTSPRIDELARLGALFENVIAESPWTLPSHASIFTGQSPATHGTNLPSQRLSDDTITLTEILAAEGYATVGLTEGGYLARDYGFNRGFDVYSDNRTDLASTLETARGLLSQVRGKQPYFLFLHTFDIHCPYEPPAADVELFRTPDEGPIETQGSCGGDYNSIALTAAQVRTVSNRYDAGIHAADALLGEFFDELAQVGAFEDTYVVVTSDHGEQLYEHGLVGHERTVHRESLRVPWIVRGPGIAPRRITATAGLSDLAPTLLELVGARIPPGMEGRSLAGWLLGHEPSPEQGVPRISQLLWKVELQSVMTPTHQLIVDPEHNRTTLYELSDPTSATVLEAGSLLERELREVLDAHLAGARTQRPGEVENMDPRQAEKLRALGYGE